jgi:hypothetical protein
MGPLLSYPYAVSPDLPEKIGGFCPVSGRKGPTAAHRFFLCDPRHTPQLVVSHNEQNPHELLGNVRRRKGLLWTVPKGWNCIGGMLYN